MSLGTGRVLRGSWAAAAAAGWAAGLAMLAGPPLSAAAGVAVLALAWLLRHADPRLTVTWVAPVLGGSVAYCSYYEAGGPAGAGHAWLVYLVGAVVGMAGFLAAEVSYMAKALDYGVSVSSIRVSVAQAYYHVRWGLLALGLLLTPIVDVLSPLYLLGGLVGVAEYVVVQGEEVAKL